MTDPLELLKEKISTRRFQVGIVGMGYVGLPLALRFLEKGFHVTGIDIDPAKVEKLNSGIPYIKHLDLTPINSARKENRFRAVTPNHIYGEVDGILICVPTPLTPQREPDLSYVRETVRQMAPHLKKGALVSLESTTYPGTTEEELLPLLSQGGNKVGEDFFLVFSPEREDPGNPKYHTGNIPKLVGGVTPRCTEAGKALYSTITTVVTVSSPRVAESAKLLENIYRSVNIALVNELKILFDRMGIDVWEVIEAASTKPFGFQPFYPGPGLGGHCIPIDPFYLTWKAREYDLPTRFIELAGEINTYMPYYVVEKISRALNEGKKSLYGSKILVLGLAYKKDVDDMRESPALKIIQLLEKGGAEVDFHDPYIETPIRTRKGELTKKSIELTKENLKKYDCVVIVTDHSQYDPDFLLAHANLIVDTRNLIKTPSPKVKKA